MNRLLFATGLLAVLAMPAYLAGRAGPGRFEPGVQSGTFAALRPFERFCPSSPPPRVVEIRNADPQVNKPQHDLMRKRLVDSVSIPNTTILLGPDVILDF